MQMIFTATGQKRLEQFIDNGGIQGDEGGIRPDSTITRAEMATVVDAVEEYTEEADVSGYKDVAKTDWFYKQVAKIVKANVMVGVGNNKWAPQGNVTREQAAIIMCKLNDVSVDTKADLADIRAQLTKLGYTDADAVSDWAAPYILAAVQNGYMSGYPDHPALRQRHHARRSHRDAGQGRRGRGICLRHHECAV